MKKVPHAPQKLPKQKGLLPSEGRANNVLPFSMPSRGVFARRLCRADFGLCLSRSWTSSKPRPTGCWRIEGVNERLPLRGSLTILPPKTNSRLAFQRSYLRFFFCPCRPKRKSLAKRKRPGEYFARCDARGGLRALHLRHLAVGLSTALTREATHPLCGELALARRVAALCRAFLLLRHHSPTPRRARLRRSL